MTVYHVKKQIRIPFFLYMLLTLIILFLGCSQDRFQGDMYINNKYDFSLSIPAYWRAVSEEETLQTKMLSSISGLDNRLLITSSDPDDTTLIISVLSMTEDQFNAVPWDQYTRSLRSMGNMVIEDDTVEHIGGFDVHWVSGNSPLHHIGVVLFTSRGKVIQIFYWVRKPVEEEILTDIENIVLSLQKTS
jgi:hypothetical protein